MAKKKSAAVSKFARISDKERGRALALARRKNGVTRTQLAESLGIENRRAARVLGQLDDDGKVQKIEDNERSGGAKLGRHNRTLIFTAS